jgi:hypothetical protein
MYCVYCITREDGKKYIGKAKNIKNRMSSHKKTKRFLDYNFSYEVLFYSEDHEMISCAEKFFISLYDTYNNGLNETPDGSGNNYTEKFTTHGFKFSDESKQKMRLNHYSKKENYIPPMLNKHHSQETKIMWSQKRKGKVHSKKFNEQCIENILNLYVSKPILNLDFKRKNGKTIDYDSAFCIQYAEKFNMSIPNLKKIIKGNNIVWKSLFEKIVNMKS